MSTTSTDRLDIIVSATIDAASATQVTALGSVTPRSFAVRFAEIFNVKDYGAVGDGITDDSAAIQAAVTAINSSIGGSVYFPAGTYAFSDGYVTPKSNVRFFGDGGASILQKLSAATTDYIIKSSTAATSNVLIENLAFSNLRSSASGTQGMLNFDGGTYANIVVRNNIFSGAAAYCDSCFFKAAAGKTLTNIEFSNNIVNSTHRMGFEVINHDNTSSYNIVNVSVIDNVFTSCDYMGVSISGPISNVIIRGNKIKDCTTNGIELVGPKGCVVSNNTFSGTMTQLISGGEGGSLSVGKDIIICNNTTNGLVTGRVNLINVGAAIISNNTFEMTGVFSLQNTHTFSCLVSGNRIISSAVNAIICDSSPNNILRGNVFDNSASAGNFATVRSNASATTGTIIVDNYITKGTGGVWVDTANSATNLTVERNYQDGVLQSNLLPLRTFSSSGIITTAGTTSTATITFGASTSWRPASIKAIATCVKTDSSAPGAAESHYQVRSVDSGSTVNITKTDVTTSLGLVLADTYGTQTAIITATVGTGVGIIWGIEVTAYNPITSIVFA